MFTSHFGNIKLIPADLVPVAISIGIPRWYRGRRELRLAPTRAMLKMAAADYDPRFYAQLAALDPAKLYHELGENAVLLCWEQPNVRCHRRAVAEWFEKHLKVEVTELGFKRKQVMAFSASPPKR